MQIGRCVGQKTRRCCASATIGCVGKDRETERITGVDVGVEGILRNILAAWNGGGCERLPRKQPICRQSLDGFSPRLWEIQP